jgi:hypothetical protein
VRRFGRSRGALQPWQRGFLCARSVLMAEPLRRYEILLPLNFNDGRPVPKESLIRTRAELKERFGAISAESQVIRGEDDESGATGDRLTRVFVDVPDTAQNLRFFQQLKERLKQRFDQLDIWMTTHPVERL